MIFEDVTPGQTKNYVVGAGGDSVLANQTVGNKYGNNGGTTSFDSYTADNGVGGYAVYTGSASDGRGVGPIFSQKSNSSFGLRSSTNALTPYCFERVVINESSYTDGMSWCYSAAIVSMLTLLGMIFGKKPFNIAAGGFARLYNTGSTLSVYKEHKAIFEETYSSGGSVVTSSSTSTAIKGTDPGCGGGGAVSNGGTATSAAGCDGAVFIYSVEAEE